jgi:hypothetical protein
MLGTTCVCSTLGLALAINKFDRTDHRLLVDWGVSTVIWIGVGTTVGILFRRWSLLQWVFIIALCLLAYNLAENYNNARRY